MTGQEIVAGSTFGKIERDAETMDGRNIGQMQDEMSNYLDTIINRIPALLEQANKLDAEVAVGQALGQAIRTKLWGENELNVYVTSNGKKAIQGVNARDIIESVKDIVREA